MVCQAQVRESLQQASPVKADLIMMALRGKKIGYEKATASDLGRTCAKGDSDDRWHEGKHEEGAGAGRRHLCQDPVLRRRMKTRKGNTASSSLPVPRPVASAHNLVERSEHLNPLRLFLDPSALAVLYGSETPARIFPELNEL